MSQIVKTEHPFAAARRALRAGIVASLLSTLLWPATVQAEEEARSADVAAARELAIEGLKLADAGQCAQAIERLSRAEKLHHAPIVLGRLGECEIAEGRIVDGTEDLRRLLREPLPSNPPPTLVKARERAQVALDGAKPKIAFLSISVREPTTDVTVTVDGQLVPAALFDRARPTDPGEHVVEASAPGYLKATRQITLATSEKQELQFRLVADPQAVVAAKDASATDASVANQPQATKREPTSRVRVQAQPTGEAAPASSNYAPSYILWSVGTAAAAVGGVFGYLAIKGKSDLDAQCPNSLCPAASQSELDSTKRDALISTVLLASGGAALAIGTVAYLVTGSSEEKPPATARVTARPVLGLGQLGLRGTF
jgi:hypothetical protein